MRAVHTTCLSFTGGTSLVVRTTNEAGYLTPKQRTSNVRAKARLDNHWWWYCLENTVFHLGRVEPFTVWTYQGRHSSISTGIGDKCKTYLQTGRWTYPDRIVLLLETIKPNCCTTIDRHISTWHAKPFAVLAQTTDITGWMVSVQLTALVTQTVNKPVLILSIQR